MDLTEGIKALVLGLPTVFLVLIMISGVISLFAKIDFEKKPKAKEIDNKPVVAKPVDRPVIKEETDDLELVAVITAAVASTLDVATDQLEIISFREISKETRGSWTIRK